MGSQHTENLFRRYKGQHVNIKTTSGGLYEGRVTEITNDYISLVRENDKTPTFVFFGALESIVVVESPSEA
ncbi:MAG: hypothetical protein ACREBG_22875 [Pyrinomonadaceae bacterium]